MLRKNQYLLMEQIDQLTAANRELMEQINQLTAVNTELQQRLNNLELEYQRLRGIEQSIPNIVDRNIQKVTIKYADKYQRLQEENQNLRREYNTLWGQLIDKNEVLSEIFSIENVYTGQRISSIQELKNYFADLKSNADYWERSYNRLREDCEERYTVASYF